MTPRQAVVQACRDLVNDLGVLQREFTKEWELRKMVGEGAGAGAGAGAGPSGENGGPATGA